MYSGERSVPLGALVSGLMGNELERGTNKSCEQRSSSRQFVCSAFRFIPCEPRKRGNHSLYLQCFHQRSFLKFSEKSYKFKFLLFTGMLNLIWCRSLRMWFAQLMNYLLTVFIGNWLKNWSNEGNIIPL